MKSENFEFLRPHNPELADLGGFAEQYAYTDPGGALVKLRMFGENLLLDFFAHYEIPRYPKARFLELLQALDRQGLVPPVVLNKLHALRTNGNKAAHSRSPDFRPQISLWLLEEAFDLAKWFALTAYGEDSVKEVAFRQPRQVGEKAELKKEKRAALQKLAAQEAQMQKLLRELEDARKMAATAEWTVEEQKSILASANQAADVLQFDEQKTRDLLIDDLLVQAGWKVAPGCESTPEVAKELAVVSADSASKGRADYVLRDPDTGIALGVVEAKRTAHSVEKGRAQAKFYADCLEAESGHRPVIFYTNGYDITIWDDAKGDVPRRLYGFYSRESLVRCLWRTDERLALSEHSAKPAIIDRRYQIEAVKRVCERFEQKRRKALIVQATGTGKTRVAIALADLLIRARWAKRVLFLCDRRELRKQAHNAFANFIESEPRAYVTAATAADRDKTIYLATYPAMMKCFQSFDVGFFDLVIADESHRSIYNRYRDLFLYFDAFQVGLTATPRNIITHDTYKIFDCEGNDPTAHFSYNDAIRHVPPYLSHFEVASHTTKFLREGIHYDTMSDEQKQELEEQVESAELVDFSREDVDKAVFNKDTDRRILRNLMEQGIREATGQHIGKTIVFARDHNHAIQLQRLFEEMYPQFMKPRAEFCAVIDNYVDRAEQLINDFKGEGNNANLTIAVSVDMLDTGIDVPEIVNLVFAKPVKSYVKFWQMIGRGTRLCPYLFGPGNDKKTFRIFDHWGNFEYFGENPPEVAPTVSKSLMQTLFEARLKLAETALHQQNKRAFEHAVGLIEQDVRALPDTTIGVREKWRQVKGVLRPGVIQGFDAATVGTLRMEIAPLMQWRNIEDHVDAYRLDLLVTRMQLAALERSGEFHDLRDKLQSDVSELPINVAQVKPKVGVIEQVKNATFWQRISPPVDACGIFEEPAPYETGPVTGKTPLDKMDTIRRELRGIMHCRNKGRPPQPRPLEIDVTDSGEEHRQEAVKLEGLDLVAYRHRVEDALQKVFTHSPVLQRIKVGQAVDDADIQPLITEINATDPSLHAGDLLIHFPNPENRLDLAIRQIIGLDAEAVDRHFTQFVQKYPALTAHQMRFLALIQQHIVNYGCLEIDKLYEPPFTRVHAEGVDGVFDREEQIEDLVALIREANNVSLSA